MRIINRYGISIILLCAMVSLFSGTAFAQNTASLINLASKGKPLCQIVIPKDAPITDKKAAEELCSYLGKVIGNKPLIVDEPGDDTAARLYVGWTAAAKTVAEKYLSGLGPDGIVVKSYGKDIVLAGQGSRGSIYAVYTFLENAVGCRWYALDADEVVPNNPDLAVPLQNIVHTPPFEYRLTYTEAVQADPIFRVKLKLNAKEWLTPPPDEYGGGVLMGGGHSLGIKFLKASDYFEKHPEWYAFRKAENKRMPTQVCLTSKEAMQKASEEVIDYIRKTGEKMISIGLEDNDQVCQCENCTELAEQEGSYSAPLVNFANYVAEKVEKQFPDERISILAYWITERPPKNLKLNSNITVIFGAMNRNFKLGLGSVPNYSRYIDQWCKLASSVYIWDYEPHFYNFIQPQPNHYAFPESTKFYKAEGVKGIFLQGSWGSAGELMAMRAWVNAHMMWNPDLDPHALMSEFTSAYYGKAGPVIMQYIDLIGKSVNRQPDIWLGTYTNDTSNWLTLDDMNAATRLFNKAEKLASRDPKALYRVRRARLSIDIVWIQRYREFRFEAEKNHKAFLGPEDVFAALNKLAKNEFGINCYREWDDLSGYLRILNDILLPPTGKAPVECVKLKTYQWLDVQNAYLKSTDAAEAVNVDDPSASDGKALLLKGSNEAMQASYDLPGHLAGRWRVYAVLKSKPVGDSKIGVAVGIYAPKEIYRTVAEFDPATSGTYKTIDMGTWALDQNAKIWIQPNGPGSYGDKESTSIDRIFLVHEK